MSDNDGDTPEQRSNNGTGVEPLTLRLRKRFGTAGFRASFYFFLGVLAASAVVLFSSIDGPGLVKRLPPPSMNQTERIAVVSTARADANGPQRLFHWTARDGTAFRAKVEAAQYQHYAAEQQRRIDLTKIRVTKETDTWVRGRLRPVLTGIGDRVGHYGDWMYNWWTAWILLGQAFGWTWQGFLDGKLLDLPNVVHARLIEEVRRQYDGIVLRPEILEPQMQALVDRAVAGVQRDILRICGPLNDARQKFVRGMAHEIEQQATAGGWVAWAGGNEAQIALASSCGAFGSEDEAKLTAVLLGDRPMSNLDAGVDAVILRLSRPFATKLISFMVLPVITTAIAGGIAVPFIGLPAGALAGLLAGGAMSALVIGFSASTAVDWLLTRADEALSRETFEAELRGAIRQAADSFEIRVANTMAQYVERQYQQLGLIAHGRTP